MAKSFPTVELQIEIRPLRQIPNDWGQKENLSVNIWVSELSRLFMDKLLMKTYIR
jgi:hypothetical protein